MNRGFPLRFHEDNFESVNYTAGSLPIRSVMSVQEDYPTLSVPNHWHNDLEFSYVTKGHMKYSVNGAERGRYDFCQFSAASLWLLGEERNL